MPAPRRRTGRFVIIVAIVVLAAACGNRDLAVSTIVPTSTTSTTVVSTTTESPTTTVALGRELDSAPTEPHIQVGLNDVTLILSLDGDLMGHVQPPLISPEFYQRRQRRLTAEVGGNVSIQGDCLVDSVIEPDRTWWVTCDPEAESGPYIGVLAADGGVTVMGRLPNPPAGASVFGHWREVFVRQDGALLAQFSGECEVPHAMFIVDGVARHVSGEGFWDDAPVPNSYAYGWLPDGRALVRTEYEAGCGSSDPEPGLYVYNTDGSHELLHPFQGFAPWGRVVESPSAGVDAQRWLQAQFGVGVSGSDGTKFVADPLQSFFIKTVAWDHGDGLVYLSEEGSVRWWRPDADVEVVRFDEPSTGLAIVDVSFFDRQVVVLERNGSLLAFDLFSGATSEGAVQRYRRVESGEVSFSASGRTAVVIGEELVVTHPDGALRIRLGSSERPIAVLHDFDGRRVIVSIEAQEPADAPRTVYVIDLECSTCTEVIETFTADSFDLVGALERAGPVVVPILTGE